MREEESLFTDEEKQKPPPKGWFEINQLFWMPNMATAAAQENPLSGILHHQGHRENPAASGQTDQQACPFPRWGQKTDSGPVIG